MKESTELGPCAGRAGATATFGKFVGISLSSENRGADRKRLDLQWCRDLERLRCDRWLYRRRVRRRCRGGRRRNLGLDRIIYARRDNEGRQDQTWPPRRRPHGLRPSRMKNLLHNPPPPILASISLRSSPQLIDDRRSGDLRTLDITVATRIIPTQSVRREPKRTEVQAEPSRNVVSRTSATRPITGGKGKAGRRVDRASGPAGGRRLESPADPPRPPALIDRLKRKRIATPGVGRTDDDPGPGRLPPSGRDDRPKGHFRSCRDICALRPKPCSAPMRRRPGRSTRIEGVHSSHGRRPWTCSLHLEIMVGRGFVCGARPCR